MAFKKRAIPAATRDHGLYGLIRRTNTHVPQWDSNPRRKDHPSLRRRTNHCATRAIPFVWLIPLSRSDYFIVQDIDADGHAELFFTINKTQRASVDGL
jgi:hypothetical protein